MRVGLGVDAHRLEPGVPLVLGLTALEHPTGLAGHSDGDVVAHAVCDALLAASGGPDIGVLFPSGADEWRDVTGAAMIAHVLEWMAGEGAEPVNVHAVIVCESPRIGPHRAAMQEALTRAVGAPVSVHATTTDQMGFTGRGEGISCQAVALVEVGG
ncbi:MAG: 2-C-methyl-D-erythritol 2,4-cyclodiphosphate synthase [Actinobacteria bacterium]|nr:2-C-methyl-D-erythritol 2,4-cyclodiphosphate synthase [Actinomycetota bacterium]